MLTAKEMLEAAWKKIEDPKNRCRGHFALSKNGKDIPPWLPNAVCFCSSGALVAVSADSKIYFEARDLLQKAAELMGYSSVAKANDLNIIDNPPLLYARAIELAEGKTK